jgi:hypothetical protein
MEGCGMLLELLGESRLLLVALHLEQAHCLMVSWQWRAPMCCWSCWVSRGSWHMLLALGLFELSELKQPA